MRKRTVLISYSGEDREFTERLAADLRASGARVWFDQWEIKFSDSIAHKINNRRRLSGSKVVSVQELEP